jgi:hypothetical protein
MPDEPSTTEPVPVQLTRVEGTINLIAYQMAEVKSEVTELNRRVTTVELAQAQSGGASQSWKTWLPILIAAGTLGLGMVLALLGRIP